MDAQWQNDRRGQEYKGMTNLSFVLVLSSLLSFFLLSLTS